MTDLREKLIAILDGDRKWPDAPETADAIIAAFPELAGWQPIETAPKDGTVIFVWHIHPVNKYAAMDSNIKKAYWIDEIGEWQVEGVGGNVAPELTHWMPLPNPPKR